MLSHRNARLVAGLVAGLVAISLAAACAHVATTYLLANRAGYPQRIIAAQAAGFLSRGYPVSPLVAGTSVDVWSGGTWLTVTDDEGVIIASSARDGEGAVSLASCREAGRPSPCFFVPAGDLPPNLTVELPSGARQAVVAQRFASGSASGYVFAGRSREATDERLLTLMRLIAATWLAGMGAFVVVNRLNRA